MHAKVTGRAIAGDAGAAHARAWIDGRWRDAASGETIDVENPEDGSLVGRVPLTGAEDAAAAVDAAEHAFPGWRDRRERAAALRARHACIVERRAALAGTMTLEQGKPIAEARGEITGAPIPFGGTRQSGPGREGSGHGLEAFTEIEYPCIDTR